jgi:hypothetical protein
MRPDERRMLDALASYPGHVIVTLRVKTEYVIEENERGKKVPRKVGLKPEQREGIDYEFDVVADLDHDNTLSVSKTRIPALAQAVISKPGPELADQITEFLEQGDVLPTIAEYQERATSLDTVNDLKALFGEVSSAGLAGAPCLGVEGKPTILGDFIRDLATELNKTPQGAQPAPSPVRAVA